MSRGEKMETAECIDKLMQNLSQHISGAEHLSDVIANLKNADKFIRQGDIHQALDEIMHARDKNPTIMYARAYEEYVRSMLNKVKFLSDHASGNADHSVAVVNEYLPTLEKILDLAIKEIKRSAVTAYKHKEVMALQKQREAEQRKEDELRTAGLRQKITGYMNRAQELQKKNDFHNALNEIARAFMLDPTDERIQQLEEQIKEQKNRFEQREAIEQGLRQKEEQERRQRLFEEWQRQRQKERDLQRRQDEERYRHARAQKIREYLQVVRSFFAAGKYDDALTQLAFVLVLDPLNEEVLSLNWKIRDEQAQQEKEHLDHKKRRLEEDQKKKAALFSSVRTHLAKAESYFTEKNYTDALRSITQAYFLDPTSEEVAAAERRILAAEEAENVQQEAERRRADEENRRRQESELHRLAIEQQKRETLKEKIELESRMLKEQEEILLYLSKARGFFSQGKYEQALSHVAAAFRINPLDDEIIKLQQEILAAQRRSKADAPAASGMQHSVDEIRPPQRPDTIARHMAEAKRLRQDMLFKEALDEIARAYQIDPLNEDLFALEGEIQQEFLRYEEEQVRVKASFEQSSAIRKSLATARECVAREAFGEALAWIDYALSFDMRRPETVQFKEEVERMQRVQAEKKQSEDKELVLQSHLSRAMEFASEQKYSEAILETDLALRLNASHPGAVSMRARLLRSQGSSSPEIV